jgi:GxxExxY protein
MDFKPLTKQEEEIGKIIVDCAYKVHYELGPGLLEKIYEICFVHELTKSGLNVKRQVPIKINYDGILFNDEIKLDILVEDLIICELKAAEGIHPVWNAQLLTYLKLNKKRLGYLINFCVPKIKDGIKRIVL